MMGRQVAAGAPFYRFRPDDHVPADRLLRRIDGLLDFGFVRKALSASYSTSGRPSIDPKLMLRMLLVGYLFGIRSERRLRQALHLDISTSPIAGFAGSIWPTECQTIPPSPKRHGRFSVCDLRCLLFEQVVARRAVRALLPALRPMYTRGIEDSGSSACSATRNATWGYERSNCGSRRSSRGVHHGCRGIQSSAAGSAGRAGLIRNVSSGARRHKASAMPIHGGFFQRS